MGSVSDYRSRSRKFESQLDHINFVGVDHDIISVVILPFLLIQEGQLSVTGKKGILVNCLED